MLETQPNFLRFWCLVLSMTFLSDHTHVTSESPWMAAVESVSTLAFISGRDPTRNGAPVNA